jgi:cytoskeletal protein RodZ
MSLIQEALKRQQEEFGDCQPSGAAEQPASAAAIPPTPPPEQTPPRSKLSLRKSVPEPEPVSEEPLDSAPDTRRPGLRVLGVLLLVLVIISAVFGLLWMAWQHFQADGEKVQLASQPAASPDLIQPAPDVIVPAAAPVESPADVAAAPPAQPETTLPSAVTPPPSASAAAQVPAEVAPAPIAPPAPAPDVVPAPAVASAPVAAPKPAPAEAPAPVAATEPAPVVAPKPAPVVAKTPAPAAPPAPPAKPVVWPRLNLSGVLCSAVPGEGAARINNTMIFAGGEIEGVTLLKIKGDGVYLRYQGETRFLKVGATLY